MKKNILLLLGLLFLFSCSKFEDLNENPNQPSDVTTYALLTYAQKDVLDELRDAWMGGRTTLALSQYWSMTAYSEETQYQYRASTLNNGWRDIYGDLKALDDIISLNEGENKEAHSLYGSNSDQIQVARILKTWIYQQLTDMFGDIPYNSYGDKDNSLFQAFDSTTYYPKYAPQASIYKDMLNELKDAATKLNNGSTDKVFTQGDLIYNGDRAKWIKFANSLRLRIAVRAKGKLTEADDYIAEASGGSVSGGLMESNEDNAVVTFVGDINNAAPKYKAFFVDRRGDFAVSATLVKLMKGENSEDGDANPLLSIKDPRLKFYADTIKGGDYFGLPYGLTHSYLTENPSLQNPNSVSIPNKEHVLKIDFSEVYMEYSEVCFLLSEINNRDKPLYDKAITASMEKWGVITSEIESYISSLPTISEEQFYTQKYISLYLQGIEGWSIYRKTGFPKSLVKPGDVTFRDQIFESLVPGVNIIPNRVPYPSTEETLNKVSLDEARKRYNISGNGTEHTVKMWWQN